MPLLKNKPFALAKLPDDLRPEEPVWHVRFTKEIFRSYEEYLERVNLYRQRVWKCKASGKIHLTYEEALVSEHEASERIQKFPKLFMEHVLRLIQFSMLNLNDLIAMIYERLKDSFVEGEELHGKKDATIRPCKILEILTINEHRSCKLGWLDKSGNVTSTSIGDSRILIRKKLPFTKDLLKLYIKESTLQNNPWVLRDKLANDHGISTEVPEELREKIATNLNFSGRCKTRERSELENKISGGKKRARIKNDDEAMSKKTKRASDPSIQVSESSQIMQEEKRLKIKKIKYPIDDLLVKPSENDPIFSKRPVPSTNFISPNECVGDILMVWDFCSSFAKLLLLSPFSLEEFENAIVYGGISNLIVEMHSAILRLLITDGGEYYNFIQQKKRKEMVTSTNWMDYLCDYIEFEMGSNSADHIMKIKRGHYYKLIVHAKLEILCGLVYFALSTDIVRGQLDKYMDELQTLVAAKRGEDLEEMRKRREEKRLREATSGSRCLQENGASDGVGLQAFDLEHSHGETEDKLEGVNMKAHPLSETHHLGKSESKRDVLASRRAMMQAKIAMEKEKETYRMAELRKAREAQQARAKEARARKLKEQRQEMFDKKMEKCFIRIDPLGKDRDHNRYWFFHREGRLFIESADHRQWGFYASKEELDGLMSSLNPKGVRELALQKKLEKHYSKICTTLQRRSTEEAQKIVSDTPVLRRSVRVSVLPKDNRVTPSLSYMNKWR